MERERSGAAAASGPARVALVISHLFVALTACAGGAALIVGALVPDADTAITPPPSYLAGSPFDSHLGPGLILAVVLGGIHLAAAVVQLRRSRLAPAASAIAGFGTLIWIFVQMVYIPFSWLQAV